MIKWLRAGALALVLLAPAAGCVARAHVGVSAVLVTTPPPQHVAVAPPSCADGHVLVEGRYHWNGTAWVWIEPACLYKPGYVWVSPSYVIVSGGVRYHAGYWKAAQVHHKAGPVKKKAHPVVKAKPVKKKGALPFH
jgi:hypothetical protein